MTEETKYTITVKEAMNILDVSRKTIYRRLRDGELDGKKVVINDTRKWLISEDSIYDNKVINETVKLEEVDKNINKDQLMNELVTAMNSQKKELLDEAMQEVRQQLQAQEKQLQQQNKHLREQNELLKQQLQAERSEDNSLLDKIKNLFK